MKKIYQYILMAVAMVATASCSNELDEALQPADSGKWQFVVSDFSAFGEGAQTRAIGLQDEGKTRWEEGDVIFLHLYSEKYGNQTAELIFNVADGTWSPEGTLSFLENERPDITVVYAPDCEISENKIVLKNGKEYGMAEYILANTNIENGTLYISFKDVKRNYSRLRIAATANETVTVTTTGFTPAGPEGTTVPESYTLTADAKGNAYLYGTFAEGGSVKAETSNNVTASYTFTSETVDGKSYALAVKLGDITDADDASTGDVALTDGSFVSNAKIAEMTDAQKAAMAGIVFWTVADTDPTDRTYPASLTDDKVMKADFPHCTHGLIVSLKNTEAMAWQGTSNNTTENIYTTFQNTDLFNPSNIDKSEYAPINAVQNSTAVYNSIQGYNNTEILKAYNDYCNSNSKTQYIIKPIEAMTSFAEQYQAPFGSTGWYLPSAKELYMLCHKDVDDFDNVYGTEGKVAINEILKHVEGDIFGDVYIWSSTDNLSNTAIAINFSNGADVGNKKYIEYSVRYVCAF